MIKNRKIKKSERAKPIIYLLIFLFSSATYAQSVYAKSIEEHREKYKAEFLKDKNSPLKESDLAYLDFYEADEKYAVVCEFETTKDRDPFELPTSTGETSTYVKFGILKFKLNGKKQELTLYRNLALLNNPLYRDYLFIPFKDLSNGKETYGGGRYLDLRMSELGKGEIILDFNKAYNPYCVFSAGYSCPIPPRENHLKIEILAGEKNYLIDGR